MDICHIYDYEKQACMGAEKYAREHCEDIKRAFLALGNIRIWTNDGNVHYFMGGERYLQWSKGKTYMLPDGTMMHSGLPIPTAE